MSQNRSDEIQQALEEAAANRGVPGAVLALSQNGKTSTYCHGVLNVESGEAVQPNSMFQVGSVTKVWTASLLMCMVDQGKVRLNAPITDYIPNFRTADPKAAKQVTVDQLLSHTSGLDGDLMTDTGMGDERLARYVDCCALLPHIFAPGADFSYSNAAYTIAGRIIEIVSGLDFDSALQRHLIEPLGLKNSVSDLRLLVGRSVSSGHSQDPDDPSQSLRLDSLYTLPVSGGPAGSTLMTSAEDLVIFAQSHLDGGKNKEGAQILSPESVSAMQEKQVDVPVPARDIDAWARGWMLMDQAGMCFFGHDGATFGQNAYLRVDKNSGTIAALFANGGKANDFMMDVFESTFDPMVGYVPSARDKEVTAGDLHKYVGTFRNVAGDTMITSKDGVLYYESGFRIDDGGWDTPKTEMRYVGGDRFVYGGTDNTFPTMVSFLDDDENGCPQRVFSGMRYRNRVS